MKRFARKALRAGVAAIVALAGVGSAAYAQQDQRTPRNWNYEIKDGKRVPKANRVMNADGSWREESRQGSCVTVKEKTASGEYKESRRCD